MKHIQVKLSVYLVNPFNQPLLDSQCYAILILKQNKNSIYNFLKSLRGNLQAYTSRDYGFESEAEG